MRMNERDSLYVLWQRWHGMSGEKERERAFLVVSDLWFEPLSSHSANKYNGKCSEYIHRPIKQGKRNQLENELLFFD